MALGFRMHRGGDRVKFGFYWNLAEWEASIVPAAGGELKGADTAKYLRLPLPALLVLAPLMGAAYAFFLPFIGFAMVLMYLSGRLKRALTGAPPPASEARETREAGDSAPVARPSKRAA
ncbi:MAG TPA: hypothetical protein VM364_19945 [Vicinamibacterales bacterium]|nr:hypothetical protein [Vicinamibacterales bacterium]